MKRNYYEILGVLPTADDVVIRAAWKALAQRYHPDKWVGDKRGANEKVAEINSAYFVLSDPIKRKAYDEKCEYEREQDRARRKAAREEELKEASSKRQKTPDSPPPKHCVECGCLIAGNAYEDQQEVQVGRSTGTWRTGLFNFNLAQMRFGTRKYYANTLVYYCEDCWKKRKYLSRIALSIILLGIFFFAIYIVLSIRSGDGASNTGQLSRQNKVTSFEETPIAGAGKFLIKLGAFRSENKANYWSLRLRELHIPNFITQKNNSDGSILFILSSGPFAERATAEQAEIKIRQLGLSPRIVQSDSGDDLGNNVTNEDGEASSVIANQQSYKPSFDCAGVLNNVESLICGDAALSRLDYELAHLYSNAYKVSSDKNKLKAEQIQWIKTVRGCSSTDCVAQSYRDRIQSLTQ